MHLLGHVAIITGGASGLGEATARRFSAAGASVAILDVNDAAGALLAAELGAHFEHCDVADATSVEHAIDGAQAALGIARYRSRGSLLRGCGRWLEDDWPSGRSPVGHFPNSHGRERNGHLSRIERGCLAHAGS